MKRTYFVLERNLLLNRIHTILVKKHTIKLLVGGNSDENNDHGITH